MTRNTSRQLRKDINPQDFDFERGEFGIDGISEFWFGDDFCGEEIFKMTSCS